jgi:hypothetical protein
MFARSGEITPPCGVPSSAYFTHRERRNRRIVNTETADGEQSAMVTVIG